MTEAEAITKTCHLSIGGSNLRNCLGSDCMAWVWNTSPPPTIRRLTPQDPAQEVEGYCVHLSVSHMAR